MAVPFLWLNAINIPIVMNQCTRGVEKISDANRSFRGELRSSSREYRRTWEATALFQDFDVADGFINMINGEGHYWSFKEGPTSQTGLSPLPGYNARGITTDYGSGGISYTNTTGDYWSGGSLEIVPPNTDPSLDCFAWDCQLEDDKWTAMFIVYDGSANMVPVVFRSDGSVYVNGDESRYETGTMNTILYVDVIGFGMSVRVLDGILYISLDLSGGSAIISDMFILPYVAPDYFVSQLSVSPYSEQTEYPSVPVTGEVTSIAYMQKPGANNAKTVAFKLTEYLDGYKNDPDAVTPVSPFGLPVLRLSGGVIQDGEGEYTRYPESI
jgi:hypothetical protein